MNNNALDRHITGNYGQDQIDEAWETATEELLDLVDSAEVAETLKMFVPIAKQIASQQKQIDGLLERVGYIGDFLNV